MSTPPLARESHWDGVAAFVKRVCAYPATLSKTTTAPSNTRTSATHWGEGQCNSRHTRDILVLTVQETERQTQEVFLSYLILSLSYRRLTPAPWNPHDQGYQSNWFERAANETKWPTNQWWYHVHVLEGWNPWPSTSSDQPLYQFTYGRRQWWGWEEGWHHPHPVYVHLSGVPYPHHGLHHIVESHLNKTTVVQSRWFYQRQCANIIILLEIGLDIGLELIAQRRSHRTHALAGISKTSGHYFRE